VERPSASRVNTSISLSDREAAALSIAANLAAAAFLSGALPVELSFERRSWASGKKKLLERQLFGFLLRHIAQNVG